MIDEIRGDFIEKYMNGNNRKCENSWSTVYGCMSWTGAFRKRKAALLGLYLLFIVRVVICNIYLSLCG